MATETASFLLGGEEVTAIVGVPGGKLAAGLDNGAVCLWTVGGALEARLESHTGGVNAVACCTPGTVVSGSEDCTVKVWSLADQSCIMTCAGHAGSVEAVAISDHIVVSGSGDCTAKVWSTSTGACVATLGGHSDFVTAVCVLPDGNVVTGDVAIRVWDRGSWTCTAVHDQPAEVYGLVGLPSGGFVASGGEFGEGGFVSLWREGVEGWRLDTDNAVSSLVSVRGVVVASTLGAVLLYQTGRLLASHPGSGSMLATSNGALLVVDAEGDSWSCKVARIPAPTRLAAIDTMATAWSVHQGTPPAVPATPTKEATVALTVALRRFCRVREAAGSLELVEPLGQAVVSFL